MSDLIDKGHLFIAQPPLLKVGKGKDEMYLQNESELTDWMLKKVCEQKRVKYGSSQMELSGHNLYLFSTNLAAYLSIINNIKKRGISSRLADILTCEDLDDKSFLQDEQRMKGLKDRLSAKGYAVDGPYFSEERGVFELLVAGQGDSLEMLFGGDESRVNPSIKIGRGLVYSNEFQRCIDLRKKIAPYDVAPFTVHSMDTDGELFAAKDKQDLLDYLLKEGKKGLLVQRYKGLGEMNPEQLWQTTMNPEKRNLLLVKVEDFVDADEIFTVLMGEQVEPRRDFIQNNALEVSTLDI
jgi:DNA gyrase subunit B